MVDLFVSDDEDVVVDTDSGYGHRLNVGVVNDSGQRVTQPLGRREVERLRDALDRWLR